MMTYRTLLMIALLSGSTTGFAQENQVFSGLGELGDQYGWSVSGVGDVNGDGRPDMLIGAPQAYVEGSGARGYIHVLSGADGAILTVLKGVGEHDDFGISVSGAGDIDRDGYADFIVGARFEDGDGIGQGGARVFSGKTSGLLLHFKGDSAMSEFGRSVASAGDVDSDGYPDVIVGAPKDDSHARDVGSAFVFSGRDGGTLFALTGEAPGDTFGHSVSGIGDINRDGYNDFAIGAPKAGAQQEGYVYVYSGRDASVLHVFQGAQPGDSLGFSVKGAGDVDMDGYPDLIAGAPGDDSVAPGSGAALTFSGKTGTVLHYVFGQREATLFGAAVSGAGDVDGDGRADLLVGAPQDEENGSNAGAVHIFSGATGSLLQTYMGLSGERFGMSVSSLGDTDGDGMPEFIAGAPFGQQNGRAAGGFRVYAPGAGVQPAGAQQLVQLQSAGSSSLVHYSDQTDYDYDNQHTYHHYYHYYDANYGWYGWYGYPFYPPCGGYSCWRLGYCFCLGYPFYAYGYCYWYYNTYHWHDDHHHHHNNGHNGNGNTGGGNTPPPGPLPVQAESLASNNSGLGGQGSGNQGGSGVLSLGATSLARTTDTPSGGSSSFGNSLGENNTGGSSDTPDVPAVALNLNEIGEVAETVDTHSESSEEEQEDGSTGALLSGKSQRMRPMGAPSPVRVSPNTAVIAPQSSSRPQTGRRLAETGAQQNVLRVRPNPSQNRDLGRTYGSTQSRRSAVQPQRVTPPTSSQRTTRQSTSTTRPQYSTQSRSSTRPATKSSRNQTQSRSSVQSNRSSQSRPSQRPSARPSSRPSSKPAARPSSRPSSRPSARPSSRPSSRPSARPSSRPSSRPSARPSSRPSSRPSARPSSRPSSRPSGGKGNRGRR